MPILRPGFMVTIPSPHSQRLGHKEYNTPLKTQVRALMDYLTYRQWVSALVIVGEK
jgi:hypothetical protein